MIGRSRRAGGADAARGPVAVVGAGLTGGSWAGLFAAAGLEVRLHDVDPGRLEAAVEHAAAAAGSSPAAASPTCRRPSAASSC